MSYYRSSQTSKNILDSFKEGFGAIKEEVSIDIETETGQEDNKPFHKMDDIEKIDHLLSNFL